MFHIHLHVLPRRNGDKLSLAKGMVLRRDPDREATAQILREALARHRYRGLANFQSTRWRFILH